MKKYLIATFAVILLLVLSCSRPLDVANSSRPLDVVNSSRGACPANTCGSGELCVNICYRKTSIPSVKVAVTPDPFQVGKLTEVTINVSYDTDDKTLVARYLIGRFVDEAGTTTTGFGTLPDHNKFLWTFDNGQDTDQHSHKTEKTINPGLGNKRTIKYQIEVEIADVMKVIVDPHIVISY